MTQRPIARPRPGPQRIKIHADEKISNMPVRPSHHAPTSSKDIANGTGASLLAKRIALVDLSNNNKSKGPAIDDDKARATAAAHKTARAASIAVRQQRIISTQNAQPQVPTKVPITRHHQRDSSVAAATIFRPVSSRYRAEEAVSAIPPPRKGIRASVTSTKVDAKVIKPVEFHETREELSEQSDGMEISDIEPSGNDGEGSEEEMMGVEQAVTIEEQTTAADVTVKVPAIEEEEEEEESHEDNWTMASPATQASYQRQLEKIRATFKDEVDEWDATMVSEYAEEIFEYMAKLEMECLPDPDYISQQTEIEWSMRTTLIDWLLQVHLRYHMLPETLWIATNIIDRFLSKRVVSLVKLQLVGITAMFVAAKYEEIMAPSVDEFVQMTDNGYSRDEILKGEKIILQSLQFRISSYCSPYSWVRRISKADDYDIQTRTLSKFLMEVTLLDHRFLRAKPSMVAAIGMYTARKMLGGDWNDAFIFYSNYTEAQLRPGQQFIIENLVDKSFSSLYVCKKYANKKFLKASVFAREWAAAHWKGGKVLDDEDEMALDGQ